MIGDMSDLRVLLLWPQSFWDIDGISEEFLEDVGYAMIRLGTKTTSRVCFSRPFWRLFTND
jgi:hypothetical protein